ncbi:hypothetical protein CEXT_388891 [Caerostris extrusa]|uniref:Uncharacterized protein n=1 Tax=Caerostris extrusa TaxID=172846 RepID=A0AAV4U1F5_CAEEX|nr:hypothetical protein CEXT_388891 [Caerostris extrusa]
MGKVPQSRTGHQSEIKSTTLACTDNKDQIRTPCKAWSYTQQQQQWTPFGDIATGRKKKILPRNDSIHIQPSSTVNIRAADASNSTVKSTGKVPQSRTTHERERRSTALACTDNKGTSQRHTVQSVVLHSSVDSFRGYCMQHVEQKMNRRHREAANGKVPQSRTTHQRERKSTTSACTDNKGTADKHTSTTHRAKAWSYTQQQQHQWTPFGDGM